LVTGASEEKIDEALRTKFRNITKTTYADQGKWYLNAYWTEGAEGQAEDVWTVAHKFIELDPKKRMETNWTPFCPRTIFRVLIRR